MTTPPPDVAAEIAALVAALDVIPKKKRSNLLIATWNLREFGGITSSWAAKPTDSPKRDWRAVALIAEIVRRFDVTALQEVTRNTAALQFLLERLGPTWRVIASDAVEGDSGNGERLAFVYDTKRVQPSGLVGEIVLPPQVDAPAKQFARTPYSASFVRGTAEFIMTTVHVLWPKKSRLPEIEAFASWMRAWADRKKEGWSQNFLVLGDFNIDHADSPLYRAFVSTGLTPPAKLMNLPRTIFFDDDKHFYDQIAWFSKGGANIDTAYENLLTSLRYDNATSMAGNFDFVPHVFAGMPKAQMSFRISDHYPMWVEFGV
jgi:endonuclease/exonuclease/phosphatase family metal-dependent hydrolase